MYINKISLTYKKKIQKNVTYLQKHKNQKLQTNSILTGQDLEQTNMITNKWVYMHMITENRAYAA